MDGSTRGGLWVSVRGDGDDVVLLHPGGTDSRSMLPLAGELTSARCILIDRPGHGRSPDVAGDWSFEDAADAIALTIDRQGAQPVHVVGWSDGAIAGLVLAIRHPGLVRSLVFGAGVFHHEGWQDGVLGGDPPSFMADAYAEVSPDGRAHWPVVVAKSERLHRTQPALTLADLGAVTCPTLIVVGDDDEVRWDHLLAMYDALPDGEFAVVPRATHGLIVEKPALLARLIADFHSDAKSDGLAPRRRAGLS